MHIYKSLAGEKAIRDSYDSLLSHWPVPYESFSVETRQGKTFIIASGDPAAPPLVLIHGSASNALWWREDIEAYSQLFRVYAVDIPGEPGRSSTDRFELDSSSPLEWMEAWLDYLETRPVALLGVSLGGWLALKFAIHHPQRITNLVLISPGGVTQAKKTFVLKAVLSYCLRRWSKDLSNRLNYGNQVIAPDTLRFMDTISDHFRPRFETLPIITDEELQRLDMPVLLIAGARDAVFPSDRTAERLRKWVTHLYIRMLPDEGHVLFNLSPLVMSSLSPELYNQQPTPLMV